MAQSGASAELAALFAQRRSKVPGEEIADEADNISEERDEQGSGGRSASDFDAVPGEFQVGNTTAIDCIGTTLASDSALPLDCGSSEEAFGSFALAGISHDSRMTKLPVLQRKSSNEEGGRGTDEGSTRLDRGNVLVGARLKLRPTPTPKNRYQSPVSVNGVPGPSFESPPRQNNKMNTTNYTQDNEGKHDEISPVPTGEGEDGHRVKSLVNQWASKTKRKVTSPSEVGSATRTTPMRPPVSDSNMASAKLTMLSSMGTPQNENAPFDETRTKEQTEEMPPSPSSLAECQAGGYGKAPTKSASKDADASDAGREISNLLMKVDEFTSRSNDLIYEHGNSRAPYDNDFTDMPMIRGENLAQPARTRDNIASASQTEQSPSRLFFNEEDELQKNPTQSLNLGTFIHSGDNRFSKENLTNQSNVGASNIHCKGEAEPNSVAISSGKRSPMGSLSTRQVLENELDEVVAQANLNELDVVVSKASFCVETALTPVKANSRSRALLDTFDGKKRRGSSSRVSASPSPRSKDKAQTRISASPSTPRAPADTEASLRLRGRSPPSRKDKTSVVKHAPSADFIAGEIRAQESRDRNVPVNPHITPIGGGNENLVENDSVDVDSISDDVTVKQRNTRRVSKSASPPAPKTVEVRSKILNVTPRRGSAFENAARGDSAPQTDRARTKDNLEAENKRLREELVKITSELSVKDAIIADLTKRLEEFQPDTGKAGEEGNLRSILKQKKLAPIPHRRANQDENERRFLC